MTPQPIPQMHLDEFDLDKLTAEEVRILEEADDQHNAESLRELINDIDARLGEHDAT